MSSKQFWKYICSWTIIYNTNMSLLCSTNRIPCLKPDKQFYHNSRCAVCVPLNRHLNFSRYKRRLWQPASATCRSVKGVYGSQNVWQQNRYCTGFSIVPTYQLILNLVLCIPGYLLNWIWNYISSQVHVWFAPQRNYAVSDKRRHRNLIYTNTYALERI